MIINPESFASGLHPLASARLWPAVRRHEEVTCPQKESTMNAPGYYRKIIWQDI
jgi:hypothetical protein